MGKEEDLTAAPISFVLKKFERNFVVGQTK